MAKIFLYAVNPDEKETVVFETDVETSAPILEKYRKKGLDIGIFGGKDLKTVEEHYKKYLPFTVVDEVAMFEKILNEFQIGMYNVH